MVFAVFVALVGQKLHTQADAQAGLLLLQYHALQDLYEPLLPQGRHVIAKSAHPRHHYRIGLVYLVRVAADHRFQAHCQRAFFTERRLPAP